MFFMENLSDNIPGLIHNVGIGIISIFLSAIIFIYTANQKEMQDWDRIVILKRVISAKWFFVYLALLFFPPFFWGFCDITNVLILLIFIVTVFFFSSKLYNIYKWIIDIEPRNTSLDKNGYRQKFREEFLREKGNAKHKTKIWSLTWSQEDINPYTEKRLMEIFFEQSENMAKNDDWENLADWLYYFNAGKEKRSFLFRESTRIIISHMLNINHREYKAITTNKPNDDSNKHFYAASSINDLLNFFISKSLHNDSASILFKTLKEHLEEKEEKYQRNTVGKIYKTLFETIPLVNHDYTIWENHFPKEWKVTTEENLKKNHIADSFFKCYLRWLEEKINFDNNWDKELNCIDDVSRELFPSASQRMLSEIITYLIRPYSEDIGKELLKNPPKFGRTEGRFYGFWESETTEEEMNERYQKEIEEQQNNTISFVAKYFKGGRMSKERIEETIQKLEEVEPENKREERRKEELLTTFKKLLSKIKERENNNTKK